MNKNSFHMNTFMLFIASSGNSIQTMISKLALPIWRNMVTIGMTSTTSVVYTVYFKCLWKCVGWSSSGLKDDCVGWLFIRARNQPIVQLRFNPRIFIYLRNRFILLTFTWFCRNITAIFSISVKAIDRIMSGTVTQQRQMMSYQEFVWFILSEEDKGTSTAAEFWFRIMDRDGDGVITLEDLEFFYKEQVSRICLRIKPGWPLW